MLFLAQQSSFPWLRERNKTKNGSLGRRERDILSKWRDVLLKVFVTAMLAYICYAIIFLFPFLLERGKHGLYLTPVGILVFWWRFVIFIFVYLSILRPLMPFLAISPKIYSLFDKLGDRWKYMLWVGWIITVGALSFQYPDLCKAVLMVSMFLFNSWD